MKKSLTKKELAAKLDGCEYRAGVTSEIIEAAMENKLVFIHGANGDLIELRGAVNEKVNAGHILHLTRKGVPLSECGEGSGCPYYKRWLAGASKRREVREIQIFWRGVCPGEYRDPVGYYEAGMPVWCFKTDMPNAVFSMFNSYGDNRVLFGLGIVIDLDEVFPYRNYTQLVMEQGGWET